MNHPVADVSKKELRVSEKVMKIQVMTGLHEKKRTETRGNEHQ